MHQSAQHKILCKVRIKVKLSHIFINAGVYLLSRSLLEDFPSGEPFSFEHDVLRPAAARETVVACTDTEGFIDIGVPDDYRQAQTRFAARRGGT